MHLRLFLTRSHLTLVLVAMTVLIFSGAAFAKQGLLAVVNDQPITSYDVQQQVSLGKLFEGRETSHKKALNDIINQVVKIAEARRYRMDPGETEVSARMAEIAKGLKTDSIGLEGKLKTLGISLSTLRRHVTAQISFARLLKYKYHEAVAAKPEDIERKMGQIKADLNSRVAKAMSDPRMRAVQVISLLEVTFPVEAEPGAEAQVLQSRAIEANTFVSRFKGCKSAKAAASGIFNVRVGKIVEVDAARLPKPLQEAFAANAVGSAIGPMRSKDGVQVLGYCGTRRVEPQRPKISMPTRAQVEQAVLNEKFDSIEQKYVAQMRKNAIIEYKDANYAP